MSTFLLYESLRPTGADSKTFWIKDPELILACSQPDEIAPLLDEVEAKTREGFLAAGFLTYEAGFSFLPNMPSIRKSSLPLAWFALTKTVNESPVDFSGDSAKLENLALTVDSIRYFQAITKIKSAIERGDTYQVNYTLRYQGKFYGSALSLYRELREKQRVNFAAFIETDDWAVVSLSPELFFRKKDRRITMRPMKGTAPRGRTQREDELQAAALQTSPKERSENLMIVDMLRNDLGKICETGSIEVTHPMQVERYETLLQMTSTIDGTLREGAGLRQLFEATFPSGSVTGAPKVRTMQIIDDLEQKPRGVYTGAVGYITADDSVFSVAIRTAVIDFQKQSIEMGVGSGILHEADAEREYRECELKGRFLTEPYRPFQIFETILRTPDQGFQHLELHLDRILSSAAYFLYPVTREAVQLALERLPSPDAMQRVRLTLDAEGMVNAQQFALEPLPAEMKISLSEKLVDSSDRFLFHKTTNRELYNDELKHARNRSCFDVLFRNERMEITEGAITNVFVEKQGVFLTPPIECGLLAGTMRRHLIESGEFPVQERVLYEQDLLVADAVYVCNALRGLLRVKFLA